MKCPTCKTITLKEIPNVGVECPVCEFKTHTNEKIIDYLYVWLSVDRKTGMEGIMAVRSPEGQSLPMVTSNYEIASKMESMAVSITQILNMGTRLIKLSDRSIVKNIE